MQRLTHFITRQFSKSKVQVVLVQDYANLGIEGEIVTVKPGHAQNFLIPNNIAVYNFPGVQKRLFPNLTEYDIIERKQAIAKAKQSQQQESQEQEI